MLFKYSGLGLVFLGAALILIEVIVMSYGVLGLTGIIAFAIGFVILVQQNVVAYQIAWPVILAVSLVAGGYFLLVISIALKARLRPVVSGREELINQIATVQIDTDGMVRVRVLGEMWQVYSDEPLKAGQRVRVIAVNGLMLVVKVL